MMATTVGFEGSPSMSTTPPLTSAVAPSAWRRWGLRGTAGVYALAIALGMFGLPSAVTAWFVTGSELPLRTHFVVWGALAGVLVPTAALMIALRPTRSRASAQQMGAIVVAVVLGSALSFEPENAGYAALLVVPALILIAMHPERSRLFTRGRPDTPILVLAVVGAVPALSYAIVNLRASANTSYLDELHGGYAQAGILALLLVLSTAVAALGAPGWRVSAWSAVVATAMLGTAGILYPSDPSSVGRSGGIGLVAAALILAVLTITRSRRQASS